MATSMKIDYLVMIDKATCANAAEHDPEVEYGRATGTTFSEWAREKGKTHRPVRCSTCGLYRIWTPLPPEWT